jgi:hypothetical protein
MGKRTHKRINVNLSSKIVSGGQSHEAFVENLSDSGMCVTTSPTAFAKDFVPGTLLEVNIELPPGETLNLHCDVRWLHSYIIGAYKIVNTVGVKIISAPPGYMAYIKTLDL